MFEVSHFRITVRSGPESEQQAVHAVLFGMKFSFLNGNFQCLLKCPEYLWHPYGAVIRDGAVRIRRS